MSPKGGSTSSGIFIHNFEGHLAERMVYRKHPVHVHCALPQLLEWILFIHLPLRMLDGICICNYKVIS